MGRKSSNFEQNAFWLAVSIAVALHVCVLAALILFNGAPSESRYKPLAVMDFAYYDPEGGEAGGGEGDEPSTSPNPGPGEPMAEPAETPPDPEEAAPEEKIPEETRPEPESEDPEPENSEQPELVTSTSEDAQPLPLPPAKEKDEPKPRPKPKAKKAKADHKAVQSSGGGGTLKGDEVKPGGGLGSGRGGTGGGTGIGNPNALNAYASKIRSKLNRLKKYPPTAASKKVGGVVTVNFTVNRQGAVISSRMVKSSGNAALDQEAMALLKRCSPFPPMPKELSQNTLNLTVPISFKPPR